MNPNAANPEDTSSHQPHTFEGKNLQQSTRNITPATIEKLYHKMVEEVRDYAILLLDPDGYILNWNPGAEHIKGYKAADIIGQNFKIFYTSEARSEKLPDRLLQEAKETGRAGHEGWRVRKDGSQFWGSVVITALHDEDNNVIGFSKLTRDLTERKAAEEKQLRQNSFMEQQHAELRRSEERYHRMIAEVEDYAIILLDNDGKILNWNKGAQNIKGYTSDEIVGRSFSTFYQASDVAAGLPQKLLDNARRNGKATHEGWRVKSDGSIFWGSIVITALHDDQGDNIGFSKVTRDLTERKQAEELKERYAAALELQNEKLKRSEEQYHRMISEVADYAIILLDVEGNVLNWNKGAENIKGYQEHEIVGKNFRTFYLPEDRERKLPEHLLAEAAANNKATHEGWRLRKDGTRFWGSIVITALHNDAGEIIGFSKVTRDLTHQKETQDFILSQNRLLEEYAYVASHDLQEPLRKIITFSNMLERNLGDEEAVKKNLAKIKESSERMTKLIKAVLEYSRTDRTEEIRETVDLNTVFADILQDFELVLQEREAKVQIADLPSVTGVPIQMHQLFSNLIGNAIKFSEGAPEIRVTSETEKIADKRFARISIADKGIGFKPEYVEKIFTMFHRIGGSISGTGIGLALCKRIAESHGGSIQAKSIPGEGSVFEVLLPVEQHVKD
jgi:PAS domain S-box-containing protein